jgi:hypothetical protein
LSPPKKDFVATEDEEFTEGISLPSLLLWLFSEESWGWGAFPGEFGAGALIFDLFSQGCAFFAQVTPQIMNGEAVERAK